MKISFKVAASLLALAPIAAGCGIANAQAASHKSASHQTLNLVFYSAEGYDAAEAAAFQKATGIKVHLSDMSTGPLLAKVAAEAQNPKWDVIWFDGNAPLATMDKAGQLLTGYSPKSLSNYNALGKSLLPANHGYFPTGVSAAGALAYNTKLVKGKNIPTTWQDLLKPAFKNAVGMNNPAVSGPTYPVVSGLFKELGVAKGEKYFENLKANGLKTFATNGVTLQALASGKIKVAIAQDSAEYDAEINGGAPIKIVYPQGGVTMLPSDIAINKKAPDMKAAKEFVNFVLSQKGQQVMQDWKAAGGDSYFQPVTTVVKPLWSRPGVVWNRVNALWSGDHEAAWVNWFTNNVIR